MIEALISTLLFVAAVIYVARPFFDGKSQEIKKMVSKEEERLLQLELESERLADLTLDLEVGNLNSKEYANLVQSTNQEGESVVNCPGCGVQLAGGDRFCRNCGAKLS